MEMRDMITAEVKRVGYRPISHRALSTHKDDWYLQVVYAYKDMQDGDTEYVVWLYNAERNGLAEGYYTTDRESAFNKYINKR